MYLQTVVVNNLNDPIEVRDWLTTNNVLIKQVTLQNNVFYIFYE